MGLLAGSVTSALPGPAVTGTVALVGAAGVAAGLGALSVDTPASTRDAAADVTTPDSDAVDAALGDRAEASEEEQSSRSASRPALVAVQRATKQSAMPAARQDVAGAVTETVEPSDPRDIAMSMLADHGWSKDEFSCLDQLYYHESNWDPSAQNPSSGAYGIPQSLPGDKMAEYGSDWQSNPETQLEWGLAYIQDRYGSPCGAWSFWTANNWY
jgi:hypothetical protein